ASREEIAANDYNLNIPRYVDTFEEEEAVDIGAVQQEIAGIEAELVQVRGEMAAALRELGL
uniref:N-6 DNA methylase n=1 Tax=uncultured Thiocystis sp. TaxID=1202134 RepID=UPI0025CD30FE